MLFMLAIECNYFQAPSPYVHFKYEWNKNINNWCQNNRFHGFEFKNQSQNADSQNKRSDNHLRRKAFVWFSFV